MKKILIATVLVSSIIILAGIYRFNFTHDDMYVEMQNGEVVQFDNAQAQENESILMTIPKKEFEAKYLAMRNNGAQLIDVRTRQEWDAGHYQEADMLVDFYATDFREQLDVLDKSTPYFIHCRSGSRSGQALRVMQSLGFTEVYDLSLGFANAQDILTITK